MYHSITIGTDLLNLEVSGKNKVSRNTWTDWHLIPATRPLVNPPAPNINRIAIPGGDGSLDLSEVIAGRTTFTDRQGSWSFYVENDFKPWASLYSEIMRYLHGKEYQCVLEDDPQYYYEGRFSVNEWRSDPSHSLIVINYVLSPYKMFFAGGENWIWDTFSFGDPDDETDMGDRIKTYKNLKVTANSSRTVSIEGNYDGASIDVYTNRTNCTLTFKGTTYDLKRNVYNSLSAVILENGSNNVVLKFNSPFVPDMDSDPATTNPTAYTYYTRVVARSLDGNRVRTYYNNVKGGASLNSIPQAYRSIVQELLSETGDVASMLDVMVEIWEHGGHLAKPKEADASFSIYISGGIL